MSLTSLPDTQRYASLIAAMELAKDSGFAEPFGPGKDDSQPLAPLHCLKSLDDLDEEADSVEDDDEEDLEDEDDDEEDDDDDEDEEEEDEDGGVKPLKMGSV